MRRPDTPPDGARSSAFELDPASGEIQGPAGTVRLAPQPAALLVLLLERRGEVVTRAEIRELLWPAGGVDVEQGIAFALREVRKALELAGCDPGVVETLPRRGYRLLADESAGEDHEAAGADERAASQDHGTVGGDDEAAIAEDGAAGEDEEEGDGRWGVSRAVATVGTVAVTVALVVATLATSVGEPVVVLHEHRAQAPELDALTRELGAALTAVLTDSLDGTAGIIGPTGTRSLSGPDDVEGARERLGACVVVSGSVAPAGSDSLVVFTQMVRAEDRVHLWALVDTLAAAAAVGSTVRSVLAGAKEALGSC